MVCRALTALLLAACLGRARAEEVPVGLLREAEVRFVEVEKPTTRWLDPSWPDLLRARWAGGKLSASTVDAAGRFATTGTGDRTCTVLSWVVAAEKETPVLLIVNQEVGFRVWLNGRTIMLEDEHSPAPEKRLPHCETEFVLPAGASRLVAAFGPSDRGAQIRLLRPDGMAPPPGVEIIARPGNLAVLPTVGEPPDVARAWFDLGDPEFRHAPTHSWVGEVLEVAPAVPPRESAYAEALQQVLYRMVSMEEGDPFPEGPVVVVHYGLRDFKAADAAHFKVGDRHRLETGPWGPHGEQDKKSLTLNTLGDARRVLGADWHMAVRWEASPGPDEAP